MLFGRTGIGLRRFRIVQLLAIAMNYTHQGEDKMRVLATYGNWQARQEGRRYLVVDMRSGVQFNCNSASHAVKKAQDNAKREAI
jgi:hypothetical protein